MAILYPGAANHQLSGKSTTLLSPRIINVHTMVWDLTSCEGYFAQPGNPYSHFGTGPNGEVYQWQDLTYRAASDLDGNPFCISIENADKGAGYPDWSGSDVPRFTDPQAEAIAHLIAWLCVRFGIPPQAVSDSLTTSVGPGYHRHGINPWRVPEGVLYSKSSGKVCPGDRRIDQFHNEIMPRVREIIAGPPPGGDDLTPEEHEWLARIVANYKPRLSHALIATTGVDGNQPGVVYLTDGNLVGYRWVQDETDLADVQYMLRSHYVFDGIQYVDNLSAFGVLVGRPPATPVPELVSPHGDAGDIVGADSPDG